MTPSIKDSLMEARADNARLRRHLTDALGDADRHEAAHTLAVSTMQAWKARAESAERRLAERASCCIKNEERLRVRDARVEPPEVEIEILAWNGPFWTAAFLHRDRKTLVFCDPDFGAGPIERAPYWLPMPPDPEGK